MTEKKTVKKKAAKAGTNRKRGRKRNQTRVLNGILLLLAVFGLLLFILLFFARGLISHKAREMFTTSGLTQEVLQYEDTVAKYAAKNEVSEYKTYLLAIMQVETGGRGNDVMQSSESLGLPPNSLEPEDSIAQGCAYFAEILGDAEAKGCDFDAVLQSYNFGIDYLDYVAKNGGDSDIEMATEFAKIKSGGEKTEYSAVLAYEVNGGWRYKYGNMFYAELVKEIVRETEEESSAA